MMWRTCKRFLKKSAQKSSRNQNRKIKNQNGFALFLICLNRMAHTRKRTSNRKKTLKSKVTNNLHTLLFTMYVNDEYTAKNMANVTKKLGRKLGNTTEMKWQWVRDGEKEVIACDFYKYN